MSHLLKCVRNNLISGDFKIDKPNNTVSMKDIQKRMKLIIQTLQLEL